MSRDQYTKEIATVHVISIEELHDGKLIARVIVNYEDRPPISLQMLAGDEVRIFYSPEVEAPDGKSLVRAAWAVLLDILGFKKVEPR